MDPLVSVEELQQRPGLGDIDQDDAKPLLDDASALVRDIASPELDDVDYDSDDRPESIVPIVVNIVRRGMQNPNGLTMETLGSYTWQGNGGGGGLPTRREKIAIRRAVGKAAAGSLSLDAAFPRQPSEGHML